MGYTIIPKDIDINKIVDDFTIKINENNKLYVNTDKILDNDTIISINNKAHISTNITDKLPMILYEGAITTTPISVPPHINKIRIICHSNSSTLTKFYINNNNINYVKRFGFIKYGNQVYPEGGGSNVSDYPLLLSIYEGITINEIYLINNRVINTCISGDNLYPSRSFYFYSTDEVTSFDVIQPECNNSYAHIIVIGYE